MSKRWNCPDFHGFGSRWVYLIFFLSLLSTSCHLMCGIVDPGSLDSLIRLPCLVTGSSLELKYSQPFLNGSIGSFYYYHIHSLFNYTPLRKLFLLSTIDDYILT
jgi:hypothetical protein